MRNQQQQARMSSNWREKEAMSTQKLMAATTHLHLKQDEEIMRLRRNVSSLAKKNHGLMRQVHELVSKLPQYPPPRIPEETRPTNQDEEGQEDPSPENKGDTQMEDAELQVNDDSNYYSLQTKPTRPTPQQNIEYETVPDCTEAPSPTPTPPIPQAQLRPLPPSHPPPPPTPPPPTEVKSAIEVPTRVEHTPLPETLIPANTHSDEEVQITILGMRSPEAAIQRSRWNKYNRTRREADQMTWRGWI